MSKPLAQLKVLDFSALLPGPYASMLMADMGAEVLRIEAICRHDLVKTLQPMHEDVSYAHLTLNRNKQSIGLDLKQAPAVEIVKRLVNDFDLVLEQFRPGVMAKLGLDYETLKAINPQLIYCSITGYGQNGSYKNRAGHDINYLALSGLASYSGTETSGPVLSGTQIADIAGGSHHAVMGILAAVIQRNTTGNGQHLDISMTDAAFALNGMFGAGAVGADIDPVLGGTLLNGGHFYGYYTTADKRYLSVGSIEPQFATQFFDALGHREWSDKAYSLDKNEQDALRKDIAHAIAQQPLCHWQTLFASLDACVEPVLTVSQASQSALIRERNMIVETVTASGEKIKQIAPVIKFKGENNSDQHESMFALESDTALTANI